MGRTILYACLIICRQPPTVSRARMTIYCRGRKANKMAWDSCQECRFGELVELPGMEFERAYCPRCGAMHGFDDDGAWFSLSTTLKGFLPPPNQSETEREATARLI